MIKRQSVRQNKKLYTFLVILVLVVAILGLVFWYVVTRKGAISVESSRQEAACHEIPREAKEKGTYEVPCIIVVTMIQYGQTVDEASEKLRLQELIKSFDATIRDDSLSDVGIYYLDVAPGIEEEIIGYLKSQKGVSGANREIGCTYKCIGPN